MQIEHNISLKAYNTFGIEVEAKRFLRITNLNELQEVLASFSSEKFLLLSGGSNMLFTTQVSDLVLYLDVKGRTIEKDSENSVTVRAMCGENWHDLVQWTLDLGYGGLENLALIPGKAGTAPVQNIGAYGVEIKDVLLGLEAIEIATGKLRYFTNAECQFGYRDSIFKQSQKGKYIIWSIDLLLTKNQHTLKTEYGDIQRKIEQAGITEIHPIDVARAVIEIRQSKLPDPKKIGNSGSFFKNPVIPESQFLRLQKEHQDLPGFVQNGGDIKIPAGWLIEKLGYKGYRNGDAGIHEKQALVLVNYGNATGMDILQLAKEIQQKVKARFDIHIEPEVNIV
jgi:UDP-N-acetylmuramate dehydrogenase